MVTSSIMKDMQSNAEAIYRPNAIRALCRIIDVRILTTHISTMAALTYHHSPLWYKALNDSSKLPLSTRILQSHLQPSCPLIIFIPFLKMSSSGGSTRLKKQFTQNPVPPHFTLEGEEVPSISAVPVVCLDLDHLPLHLPSILPYHPQVILRSITPWVSCMSFGSKTEWR
jgi:hypothetical protein